MVCVIIVVNIKLMNTASFDITVWSKSPNGEGYTYNDVLTQNIISKCNFDLRKGDNISLIVGTIVYYFAIDDLVVDVVNQIIKVRVTIS